MTRQLRALQAWEVTFLASLNRVVLIGNLTKDPELRFTPAGSSVANLRMAVNRRWTNREGERVDSTDFFNVVVWGKLAELCAEYVRKGSPIAADGRLQSRSWETEDGQKRSTVEVVAENVQFLGRAQQTGTSAEVASGGESRPQDDDLVDKAVPKELEEELEGGISLS